MASGAVGLLWRKERLLTRSAVIVGAGLGGLATALRLQRAGWQVRVLEKNDRPGGRCNILCHDGFRFDTGPTLLLMRDVLDDLFAESGRTLPDYLDLIRVQPNYRVRFGDGSSVEFSADLERMGAEVERLEPGAAAALARYLGDAAYKYRVSRQRFVERNFLGWRQFATLPNLYYLLSTNALRKLDRHARRYFREPRLVAALTFQTMYLGLAPADAPAVYSLLPYTEIAQGIWFPRGGMYRIVQALVQLGAELGVVLETGREVTELVTRGRRVTGVQLGDGETLAADAVIINADLPYAYQTLLPTSARAPYSPERLQRLNYGSSAFLLYLGVDRDFPELGHHNVYLSRDPGANFAAIFDHFTLPRDPSFYVGMATRTDPESAPAGQASIYVLVPVPRLTGLLDWSVERDPFRDRIYQRLAEVGLSGLRKHVVMERTYTPLDFAADYNLAHGSAFGLSHTFRQVGYMRPANKARRLDNLYFVGASTVPGGGVPMVIIGSKLVTERVQQDWGNA